MCQSLRLIFGYCIIVIPMVHMIFTPFMVSAEVTTFFNDTFVKEGSTFGCASPCWIKLKTMLRAGKNSVGDVLPYFEEFLHLVRSENDKFGTVNLKTRTIRFMGGATLQNANHYKSSRTKTEVLYIPSKSLWWNWRNFKEDIPSNILVVAPAGSEGSVLPRFLCEGGDIGYEEIGISVDKICQTFIHTDSYGNVTDTAYFYVAYNQFEQPIKGGSPKTLPTRKTQAACLEEFDDALQEQRTSVGLIKESLAELDVKRSELQADKDAINKVIENNQGLTDLIGEMLQESVAYRKRLPTIKEKLNKLKLSPEDRDKLKLAVAPLTKIIDKAYLLENGCNC